MSRIGVNTEDLGGGRRQLAVGRVLSNRLLMSAAVAAIVASVPLDAAMAFGNDIDDMLGELVPVSNEELASHRGGMKVGGFDISFTVSVRTTVTNPNVAGVGPVVIETGFAIGDGGQLSNLGTTISDGVNKAVQQSLQDAGISKPGSKQDVAAADVDLAPVSPPPPPPSPQLAVMDALNATTNDSISPPKVDTPTGNAIVDNLVDVASAVTETVSEAVNDALPALPLSPPVAPATTGAENSASQQTVASASPSINSDPEAGILQINSGGTSILNSTQNGHMTLIENTDNNVLIQSRMIANYRIENYGAVVTRATGYAQINNISQQILQLGAIGRF